MKLEEQVLSVEQMQHLKELGVEVKDTALSYLNSKYSPNIVILPTRITKNTGGAIPTLTLQEILEMLPTDFLHYNEDDTEVIYGKNAQMIGFSFERIQSGNNLNILDCVYRALCWCAANGHLNKE